VWRKLPRGLRLYGGGPPFLPLPRLILSKGA
jgi:hypothetical protein